MDEAHGSDPFGRRGLLSALCGGGSQRVWDGAFYRVRRDGYEICFVPDAGVPLDEIDDVDMWVLFDSGERWSGTICTLDVVRRDMDRCRETGECLGGRYFYVWDGLIVRDRGIPAMVDAVDDLVRTGDYTCVFRDVGPEDAQDSGVPEI